MITSVSRGFLFISIITSLLFSASVAFAQVTDDTPTDTNGGLYCPNLTETMQRYSCDQGNTSRYCKKFTVGDQVTELQTFLGDYFDLDESVIISGLFGKTTEKYVKQFQTTYGLPAFGIAGTLTRAKIKEVCSGAVGPVTPSCPVYQRPLCRPGEMLVQKDGGNVSGCAGPYACVPTSTPQKCGVNTFQVIDRCGEGMSRTASVQCYDGSNPSVSDYGLGSCTSNEVLKRIAESMCKNKCSNSTRPTPTIKLMAEPQVVPAGGTSTVTWSVKDATRCFMQSGPVGGNDTESSIALSGQKQFFNIYQAWHAKVGCANEDGSGKDGPADSRDVIISVAGTNPTRGITVTAPNGGEQWEIGQLNTVTWAPYKYNSGPDDVNPARDVTAYLEQCGTAGYVTAEGCATVGKVQESGKASIHWQTGQLDAATNGGQYANPGQYYIRVVNNLTGESDRSDRPFTILPRPLKVKVNGSETPFAVNDVNQPITVSWESVPGVYGCQISGLKNVSFSTQQPSSGSVSGLIEYQVQQGGGSSYGVHVQCTRNLNGVPTRIAVSAPFYINYSLPTTASLQITSPNGGESFLANESMQVKIAWRMEGITTPISVALYKDDKWLMWLEKNLYLDKSMDGTYSYIWAPGAKGPALPALTQGVNSGYKIYITGQKADGTGYVEDKSDAPFSYYAEGMPTPRPACIVSTNKPTYSLGEAVHVSWTSKNATYAAFDVQTSTGVYVPGDKLSANGSQAVTVSGAGSYSIVMRAVNADGVISTCAVPFTVSTTPFTPPGAAACTFNGTKIAHGSSVTAYGSYTYYGGDNGPTSACGSEIRTCNNGVLSGSYTESTSCYVPVIHNEQGGAFRVPSAASQIGTPVGTLKFTW